MPTVTLAVPTRKTQIAALAIAALASLLLFTVPAALAARSTGPAALDFSFTGGGPGNGSVELGAPQGDPVCTTASSGAQTCVTRIGTNVTHPLSGGALRDTGTGEAGQLEGSCSVMYEGTMTTYTARAGRADATGSEDCSVTFAFVGGDKAFGSVHEQRVLVDNLETNTFTITITGGTGRFAGLNSTLSVSDTNPWTPSPPMGARGGRAGGGSSTPGTTTTALGVRALAVFAAKPPAGSSKGGNGGGADRITLKPTSKPIADITSLGLLIPANAPAKVAVAAAAGSTCRGTISGKRTIALAPVKVPTASAPTILVTLPVGTVTAKQPWKLRVICTTPSGGTALVTRTLKGFTVLR